jgi:hypothetical protein
VSKQLFVNGCYYPDTRITHAQDKFKAYFIQALHMVKARMTLARREPDRGGEYQFNYSIKLLNS